MAIGPFSSVTLHHSGINLKTYRQYIAQMRMNGVLSVRYLSKRFETTYTPANSDGGELCPYFIRNYNGRLCFEGAEASDARDARTGTSRPRQRWQAAHKAASDALLWNATTVFLSVRLFFSVSFNC
jgi:hypothetical protein